MAIVLPIRAASPNSRPIRRMVAAGIEVTSAAVSGVQGLTCSFSNPNAGRQDEPATAYVPRSAGSPSVESANGLARAPRASQLNFQMFKLVLEKAEEPETKLPTSA